MCKYVKRRKVSGSTRNELGRRGAERLCPEAIWLSGRMDLYVRVSREIRKILHSMAPVVEPLSIDEAFLDLTGVVKDLAGGREVALELKERIQRVQRLTASAGVAPNKFLAKIASDLEKPNGLVVFPLKQLTGFENADFKDW